MSILCSICQDFLTERPQTLTPTDELVMVALGCGHLFHHVCVQKWFQSTAQRTRPNGTVQGINEGSCPCCKKAASLSNAIKIFPTGDEDANAVVQQKRALDNVIAQNEKLNSDLDDSNRLLRRISSDLEEEIVAHDMLKMEYGQALSKMQALQEQLNDHLSVRAALENSMKTEIEKMEKEKNDALQTIVAMEAREKQLITEMEFLQVNDKENIPTSFQRAAVSQHPRENTNVQNKSTGIRSMMIIKQGSGSDETSDGESPSTSPSSSQPKQHFIPIPIDAPYSDVDESNQSDCD